MKELDKTGKKNKMDMMNVEKLYEQHLAGFSIRKLSLIWNLPYASLYRALKKVEEERGGSIKT